MGLRQAQGFRPVIVALLGNALVTGIKFLAAISSGSSTMLSESVHSLADTLNQLLLLIGLRQSQKKPDDDFEYGFGNERFFWGLISACGIFFFGAGITAYQGFHAFISPEHLTFSITVFIVLIVSFCIELSTFSVAARQLAETFPNISWRKRIKDADASTLAVILEDAVAVFGVVIATLAIGLSYYTGSSVWDAAGSIIIALLLATVAIVLILKNRSYLLGHSMPERLRQEIIEFLEKDPAIEKVIDFKSSTLGLGVYRIKFEIEFNGSVLLQASFQGTNVQKRYEEIQADFTEFMKFSAEYADRIPRLMGKKIDEIEIGLKKKYPSVRHIDIEIN